MVILSTLSATIYAQSGKPQFYAGIGGGYDYGGFGAKLAFLPEAHIGLFGGLGYNLLSAGWNLGAEYEILPGRNISPTLMAMYGYNAVFKGKDSYTSKYNMTSYGVTFGAGIDILAGSNGNKLSVGITVPIRAKNFMYNYDIIKDDPNVEIKQDLIPVGFTIGYNFLLTQ